MAKTTTSLYYIICSQLLNNGYNEFISEDGNQISFFDPSRRVMGAICNYDNLDIRLACQQTIFFGLSFLGVKRLRFEKEFINRFLNRNIKYQTYETARNLLVQYALQNSETLTAIYSGENFIQSKSESVAPFTGAWIEILLLLTSLKPLKKQDQYTITLFVLS